MVDDTKYVIVPNQQISGHNPQGDLIADLVKEGYRITHKASNKDSVHYVLIKFKPGSRPVGGRARPYGAAAPETEGPFVPSGDEDTAITEDEPIPF